MKKLTQSITVLFCVLLSAVSMASDTVAIFAGHIIDPATGKVHNNQTILVSDDTIVAVGENLKYPKDTPTIDLSDAWVMPGLMDTHVHLTVGMAPISPPFENFFKSIAALYSMEPTALRALRGLHNANVLLNAGFTTVKDIGNSANYAAVQIRRAIDQGWFPGPTIFSAGKIIGPYGGQLPGLSPEQGDLWRYENLEANTANEMRRAIRENIYYGANTIKLSSEMPAYTEEEIRVAVEEAARAGLKVSVHVTGEAVTPVILAGADVEHGDPLTDKQLTLMKKHGTYLSGTEFTAEVLENMGVAKVDAVAFQEVLIDRFKRAYKTGVKMTFSTDVIVDIPGKSRADVSFDYLNTWVAADIPPAHILKSMTTHGAEMLGIANERGAIKAGFKADIIATPKNPLEDIEVLRNVNFVMKNGRVIRSD